MDNDFYVYAHVKPDTKEVFYVGKGKDRRAFDKRNRNKFWNRIYEKHGLEVIFLKKELTQKEALILEQDFIKMYGRRQKGEGTLTNLTDGGDGCVGYIPTKEVLLKRSLAIKGRILILVSIESLQSAYDSGLKLREVAKKYNLNINTVRKYIKQTKKRNYFRIYRRGYHSTGGAKKGSIPWNKNIGDYMRGDRNHFYGKTHKDETRELMRNKKNKKVLCINTGEVYESTLKCSEALGIADSLIAKCSRGYQKETHGLKFKYV